jgi:membrane-associated phospholipid phosphatase
MHYLCNMKKIIADNKYFYGSIVLFALLEGILLALVPKTEVTLWVNGHGNAALDQLFLSADHIGTSLFSITTVVLLRIGKSWSIALKAAACFFAVMAVTQFAKYVLFPGVPRPTLCFGPDDLRLIEGVRQLRTESFPSGHTSASFALATFFALYWPNKRWHWLLALLAFAVSYARIYLAQHFITDVYAGMLIGVILTTLLFAYADTLKRVLQSGMRQLSSPPARTNPDKPAHRT